MWVAHPAPRFVDAGSGVTQAWATEFAQSALTEKWAGSCAGSAPHPASGNLVSTHKPSLTLESLDRVAD